MQDTCSNTAFVGVQGTCKQENLANNMAHGHIGKKREGRLESGTCISVPATQQEFFFYRPNDTD